MAKYTPQNVSPTEYYRIVGSTGDGGGSPIVGRYYQDGNNGPKNDWPAPPPQKSNGEEISAVFQGRKARNSIFNRYAIFFFNNTVGSAATTPDPYLDTPSFYRDPEKKRIQNPTAAQIIKWAQAGTTNQVDYAWEDFLWCKNYGIVPNNYMITMRRFKLPVNDDLLDKDKNPAPDVGRMIAWVDGESNTWESVGLKWTHNLKWKPLESEIQTVQSNSTTYRNEGGALSSKMPILGSALQNLSYLSQEGNQKKSLQGNPEGAIFDPYSDPSKVYGPINVIKNMIIRDSGLEFAQEMTIKFEYELRSIDGINPRIAMIDLLSNVMVTTYNKASWWGGEIRFVGGANSRKISPLGNPKLLAQGDYAGYLKSLTSGITNRVQSLTGGAGLTLEGISNAAKNLGGNLLAKVVGGALDDMGRPDPTAMNGVQSLLSGVDTGEWHVTVGNPMNPIIMIGNLVLDKTEVKLHGALGLDDFPSKLDVICVLKPARPRDLLDVMSMFHRGGRTYLTTPPVAEKYPNAGKPNLPQTTINQANTKKSGQDTKKFYYNDVKFLVDDRVAARFPNQTNSGAILRKIASTLD